jgi:hypothetical protein
MTRSGRCTVIAHPRGFAASRGLRADEKESAAVVDATTVETDSFAAIASSIEELSASIGQIAEDVEGLSEAADTVHPRRGSGRQHRRVHHRSRSSTPWAFRRRPGRWRTPSGS